MKTCGLEKTHHRQLFTINKCEVTMGSKTKYKTGYTLLCNKIRASYVSPYTTFTLKASNSLTFRTRNRDI